MSNNYSSSIFAPPLPRLYVSGVFCASSPLLLSSWHSLMSFLSEVNEAACGDSLAVEESPFRFVRVLSLAASDFFVLRSFAGAVVEFVDAPYDSECVLIGQRYCSVYCRSSFMIALLALVRQCISKFISLDDGRHCGVECLIRYADVCSCFEYFMQLPEDFRKPYWMRGRR